MRSVQPTTHIRGRSPEPLAMMRLCRTSATLRRCDCGPSCSSRGVGRPPDDAERALAGQGAGEAAAGDGVRGIASGGTARQQHTRTLWQATMEQVSIWSWGQM